MVPLAYRKKLAGYAPGSGVVCVSVQGQAALVTYTTDRNSWYPRIQCIDLNTLSL